MKKSTYGKVLLAGTTTLLVLFSVQYFIPDQPFTVPAIISQDSQVAREDDDVLAYSSRPSTDDSSTHQSPSPVTVHRNDESTTLVTKDNRTFPVRIYKPLLTPNDPTATQWWTNSTGLETAWGISAGATQTTVAVIDTGFGLKHEELTDRWATNVGEQGVTTNEASSQLNCSARSIPLTMSCNLIDDDHDGVVDNEAGATTKQNPSRLNCTAQGITLSKSCNRLDDDGNGYVDDVLGWDFVNMDNSTQAGEVSPGGSTTTHGTQVSGVLAATGNNGKGIAGVDWSTKILPLQAINDDGYGDTLTVANAVEYAADRNVDVISISLGADAEDPYLRQVIQYALDQGSIIVAASGNDGCDCISFPARYPEVVAVGAQSSTGSPASFSSYGSSLDILAPGSSIATSSWSSGNPTSAYSSNVAGTSFATPYISGLLSLARSRQPQATWGELLGALLSQADHSGLSVGTPVSSTLGSGYAHAGRFMDRVTTPKTPGIRYAFGPLSAADTLGSYLAYQCEANEFPTTATYELTRGSSVRYTLSPLEEVRSVADGWVSKRVWYGCLGLPSDTPTTVRTLNLLSEVKNGTSFKEGN